MVFLLAPVEEFFGEWAEPIFYSGLLWIGRDYSGSLHRLESTKVADKGCNVGGGYPISANLRRFVPTDIASIETCEFVVVP